MEIKLLRKENTPENVIEHCKAVCKKAMEIAANFDYADKEIIRKGALLHDIGRSKHMESPTLSKALKLQENMVIPRMS